MAATALVGTQKVGIRWIRLLMATTILEKLAESLCASSTSTKQSDLPR